MRHGPGAYQTIWGANEQPTTTSALALYSYGNYVIFNVPGNIVGMRRAWRRNTHQSPQMAYVGHLVGTTVVIDRVCMNADAPGVGIADFQWLNMFIHPFLHVAAGERKILFLQNYGQLVGYNDGALLAGPLTIGNFTYPQDVASPHNGAIDTLCRMIPGGAANGRRFGVDVLFLPD